VPIPVLLATERVDELISGEISSFRGKP